MAGNHTDLNEDQSKLVVRSLLAIATVFVLSLTIFVLTSDNMPNARLGGDDGKLGGEFTLESSKGDVSLSDFRDKVVLVYFGFTNCKYVCPNSANILKGTLNKLTQEELKSVQALFISVDPERDTTQVLDAFTQKYHPKILGLRGEQAVIDKLSDDYGAYFRPKDDTGEEFRHTARYYIIDQKR